MIRYAVVGAGWISQEAFMPAVAATRNSRMQAIVSGNTGGARQLADFYAIPEVLDYADYDVLIASDRIDAVYIALPNDLHADYTIRALKAGKHVMVEKPLATTLAEGEAMLDAATASGAFLMTAYRLHNEPGTHAMLEAVRTGRIGDPVYVGATFGFQTQEGNHRLKAGHWGGPLPDVGVYCLNAARHIFAAEPVSVQAMAIRPVGDRRFDEIDSSLAVTLKFPGERLAQFFCSFGSATSESIRILGSTGELMLDPAFKFDSALRMTIRVEGKDTSTDFALVDHFTGQIAYFSDCILSKSPPEADGEEGLADLRALLAIDEAVRTGDTVRLTPRDFKAGPRRDTLRTFAPTSRRLLV
jgi:predicted dehydrogenase